jgi:hypothetical protein
VVVGEPAAGFAHAVVVIGDVLGAGFEGHGDAHDGIEPPGYDSDVSAVERTAETPSSRPGQATTGRPGVGIPVQAQTPPGMASVA